MAARRGISCAKCLKLINRYDDDIECEKCKSAFHILCVDINIDKIRQMSEEKTLKSWRCDKCKEDITQTEQTNTLEQCQNIENTPMQSDESLVSGLKIELIARENEFLKRENKLLQKLVSEMDDKFKLMTAQIYEKDSKIKKLEEINVASSAKGSIITTDNKVQKNKKKSINNAEAHSAEHQTETTTTKPENKQENVNKSYAKVTDGSVQSYNLNQNLKIVATSSEKPTPTIEPIVDKLETIQRSDTVSLLTKVNNETEFKVVQHKRQRKANTIVGTAVSEVFRAAPKNIWLHIGHVEPSVTQDVICNYIKSKTGTKREVVCEKLETVGRFNSYKVGVDDRHYDELYKPDFWPTNITVRRYNIHFLRKRAEPQEWERK